MSVNEIVEGYEKSCAAYIEEAQGKQAELKKERAGHESEIERIGVEISILTTFLDKMGVNPKLSSGGLDP